MSPPLHDEGGGRRLPAGVRPPEAGLRPALPTPESLLAAACKALAQKREKQKRWHAQDVAASVRRPELDGVLLASALDGLAGVLGRAAALGRSEAAAWRLLPRRDYALGEPPLPSDLVGAARQFWDACEAARLAPAIRPWDAEATSGQPGWEIVLRWPEPGAVAANRRGAP